MKPTIHYIKTHKALLWVLIPAFIAHMLVSMPSGSHYCFQDKCGLYFWGAHGHDAIWHLAIINTSFKSFPFVSPIFAGELLKGYNYLLDIGIFLLSKIGIPALFTYFKIIPFLWFFGITAAIIQLGKVLHKNSWYTWFLAFFILFGGSFSYLLTLYHEKTILGSSGALAMQSGLSLVNPQFAISLIVLTILLTKLKTNTLTYWQSALFAALAFGLKFYAGVITATLIGIWCMFSILRNKNRSRYIKLLLSAVLGSTLIALWFYWPPTQGEPPFGFAPMATIHPIIEERGLFYLKDTVNARYFLQEAMKNGARISPRFLGIEALTLGLFIIFNLGTRIIGIAYFLFLIFKKRLDVFHASVAVTILAGFTLTTLLVQRGVWWNTIQFTYYSIFLSSIFAAYVGPIIMRSKLVLKYGILLILIILTIPTSIDIVYGFTRFPAPAYLPDEELSALQELRDMPDGIIYTTPFSNISYKSPTGPTPLFAYDDTAYVAAFSGKQTFITNKTQLDLLNTKYKDRLIRTQEIDCLVLDEASYIYTISSADDPLLETCLNEDIFTIQLQNKATTIFAK